MEYAVQAWCPWKEGDIRKLESVQRRATRLVEGCRGLSYEDRLRVLGLSSLLEGRKRGDMILTFRLVKGLVKLDQEHFFATARDGRTRGHNFKLAVLRSSCDARKYSFSRRVVPVWNSLPSEVVCADSVESFKSRYDRYSAGRIQADGAGVWIFG